jgi:hypothetical protein
MNSRQGCLVFTVSAFVALALSGCASNRKQRSEQREKVALASGLYCDFVNGEKNPDIEIELNLSLSKRCDVDKPYSITSYKTPAEVGGVLFCCAIKRSEAKPVEAKAAGVLAIPPTSVSSGSSPKDQSSVDKKAGKSQDKSKGDSAEDVAPL